jgi:hypothetical protein
MSGELLGKELIVELLEELGRRLDERGVHADLYLVGGGAMALAYNRQRITRDIDAVFEPKAVVYGEAKRMADDLGLPAGWLNDGVQGFLPPRPDGGEQVQLSSPGISVSIASAEYLFAMKGAAARIEEDTEDLRLLAGILGITTADEALDLIERYYAKAQLTPKSKFMIQELFDNLEIVVQPPAGAHAPRGARGSNQFKRKPRR